MSSVVINVPSSRFQIFMVPSFEPEIIFPSATATDLMVCLCSTSVLSSLPVSKSQTIIAKEHAEIIFLLSMVRELTGADKPNTLCIVRVLKSLPVLRSQTFMVPSSDPEIILPSETATELILPLCPLMVLRISPVSKSHTFIMLSFDSYSRWTYNLLIIKEI